jgi:hypothetical protein
LRFEFAIPDKPVARYLTFPASQFVCKEISLYNIKKGI